MNEVIGTRGRTVAVCTEDDNLLNETEKSYQKAEEDLLKYVSLQIERMEEHLLFGGSNVPSFYALNKSLMDYESVMLGLISIHQDVRVKFDIAKAKYDDFYATKFVEVKESQATLDKKSAFSSAKEIEMMVRKKYMSQLAKLRADVITYENEYNTINHIIDSWKNYQFVLSTLSKNAQAEASAASVATHNPKTFDDDMATTVLY
jgi:hypothetical protein